MKCEHCDSRLNEGDSFIHRGHHLCCECMSMLCSWLLDGGTVEEPELFPWARTDREPENILPELIEAATFRAVKGYPEMGYGTKTHAVDARGLTPAQRGGAALCGAWIRISAIRKSFDVNESGACSRCVQRVAAHLAEAGR